jgi:hypothetical protein
VNIKYLYSLRAFFAIIEFKLSAMKKTNFTKIFCCSLIILLAISVSSAQKRKNAAAQAAKPKPIIFAVLNDGTTLEPIAQIDKGELKATVGGDSEPKDLTAFAKSYYKPKTTYNLIFAGSPNGTVTVKSADPKSECAKNMATVTTQSPKAKLKGFVMGLATNASTGKMGSGLRRMPTAAERAEIETLVRAAFTKENLSVNALKNLRYHNLTAVDADGDGTAELVGSYWVANTAKERNLLFFIAEKDKSGKYSFGHSEYEKMTSEEIMSGAEITALDQGVYHELLLDVFDTNGDKTAEIFTYTQGLEGAGFTVYRRDDAGKWVKAFEGSNYHCAF